MSGLATWREAQDEGFAVLEISPEHLALFEDLPKIFDHGDPFDHLILAQAKAAKALLVTANRHMTAYGITCIGVR